MHFDTPQSFQEIVLWTNETTVETSVLCPAVKMVGREDCSAEKHGGGSVMVWAASDTQCLKSVLSKK